MLVRLNSSGAVRVLERAIRGSVKEMDQLSKRLDRLLDAQFDLLPRIRWLLKGYDEGKNMDDEAGPVLAKFDRIKVRIAKAQQEIYGHLSVLEKGVAALGGFHDAGAWKNIEKGAANDPNPLMRQLYVAATEKSTRAESAAVLCGLIVNKDSRIRAAAVRSLIPHVNADGVRAAVAGLTTDPNWSVRLGAMQVMAGAPFADAVAYLVAAAMREDGELAHVADSYLEALVGVSFAQRPGHWSEWWKKNENAVRGGTWTPPMEDAAHDGARTVASFFRIPIVSRRLMFVLDFSGSMSEPFDIKDVGLRQLMAGHGLPGTRLGYAQAEFIRAITVMRDGAYFNVLGYSVKATRFSSRLVKLNKSSRKRAIRWVKRLETDDLTNIYAALRGVFDDYLDLSGGVRRFDQLPDTVMFLTDGIATRGRFQDTESLLSLLRLWNRPVGTVFHCVGIGKGHDRKLLKTLAKMTDGYYVDVTKGLRALETRRRALPAGIDRARGDVDARSARLKGLLDRLAGADAEEQIAAAKELGEKGPKAAFAAKALADALDDYDPSVQEAATEALVKIGAGAVPALIKVLDDDDPDVVANAAIALRKIGKPAALKAIPALKKHADHWDSRAQKLVLEALAAFK